MIEFSVLSALFLFAVYVLGLNHIVKPLFRSSKKKTEKISTPPPYFKNHSHISKNAFVAYYSKS
jgi:hypothetical protein